MISSRGGRNRSSWRSSRGWLIGLPPTANLAVEGITDDPNRESQTARELGCTPGFLAKSITCSGQIIALDQHEKYLFLASAGPYAAPENPRGLLTERVESLVSQEHAKWASAQEGATQKARLTPGYSNEASPIGNLIPFGIIDAAASIHLRSFDPAGTVFRADWHFGVCSSQLRCIAPACRSQQTDEIGDVAPAQAVEPHEAYARCEISPV
jgi:hypothetical protein